MFVKVYPTYMSKTPDATTDTKHLVNLRGRPGALYQLLQMKQLLGGSVQVCAIRCIRYKVDLKSAADILLTCVSGPLLDWLKIGPNRQTMLVSCSSWSRTWSSSLPSVIVQSAFSFSDKEDKIKRSAMHISLDPAALKRFQSNKSLEYFLISTPIFSLSLIIFWLEN